MPVWPILLMQLYESMASRSIHLKRNIRHVHKLPHLENFPNAQEHTVCTGLSSGWLGHPRCLGTTGSLKVHKETPQIPCILRVEKVSLWCPWIFLGSPWGALGIHRENIYNNKFFTILTSYAHIYLICLLIHYSLFIIQVSQVSVLNTHCCMIVAYCLLFIIVSFIW